MTDKKQEERYLYKMDLQLFFEPLKRDTLPSEFSTYIYITHNQLCKIIDTFKLPINTKALFYDPVNVKDTINQVNS